MAGTPKSCIPAITLSHPHGLTFSTATFLHFYMAADIQEMRVTEELVEEPRVRVRELPPKKTRSAAQILGDR